jgi:HAD superfamily hydrolase (TIGR01549 family)
MRTSARAVLCDLDDTLFDHARATRLALASLRDGVPEFAAHPFDDLCDRHRTLLDTLHLDVLAGRVSIDNARAERFRRLLEGLGARDAATRAGDLASGYRAAYETSWHPVAGAVELARALQSAAVPLIIVTNNIVAEQRIKLAHCGLTDLVTSLVTSEEVGSVKPDRKIFDEALARAGVRADEAVMLGDAWSTDIVGALGAGIRAVWLNRDGVASPDSGVTEIRSLEPTDEVVLLLLRRA